jgi:hypothetical protein
VLRRSIPDQRDGITTDNGPGVGWVENRDTLHWLENRGTVPAKEISVDVVRRDRWSAAEDQGMLPSCVSLSAVLKSVARSFPVTDQAVSAQPAAVPSGPVPPTSTVTATADEPVCADRRAGATSTGRTAAIRLRPPP